MHDDLSNPRHIDGQDITPMSTRCHINIMEIGEPFRYAPGGEIFVRVGGHDAPVRVARQGAPHGTPSATADATHVYPVNPTGRDVGDADRDRAERDVWERWDLRSEEGGLP